jgi:hypothetical protein
VIDECGFLDLGFRGLPFTWCNNRRGNATTWLRLDRFMATNEWVLRFNLAVVDHLKCTASDHKPICLTTQPVTVPRPRKRLFRFEDMWCTDPNCYQGLGAKNQRISDYSSERQNSEVWRRAHEMESGSVWEHHQATEGEDGKLKQAKMDNTLGYGHDTEISIRHEVNELLLKEEKMWKQRSRDSWLKEGDRNTKYFHSRASHRRRRNSILSVRSDAGELVTNPDLIGTQFTAYYQDLFIAAPLEDVAVVLDGIQPCVTREMNQALTC